VTEDTPLSDAPFRSDVPPATLTEETDAFGHRDYAAAIASIVRDATPPFTLGLFGPWGLGKTTIIEEVARRLREEVAFGYFDVWRYEDDALRRQFLRDIATQLYPDESSFDPEKELSDLDEASSEKLERSSGIRWESFREAALRAVLAGLFAFLLLRVVGTSSLRNAHGAWRDAVISGLIALIIFVITPLTQVFRVTEETLTRSRLEDPEHFTERFEQLLRALKKDRLVIAVDNLDRCSPARVEELLSTIKTYLEPAAQKSPSTFLQKVFRTSPGTKDAVFLIAADDAALRRHLEAREAAESPRGDRRIVAQYVDEYLRKFFTTTVRIHPLLDQDMRSYVERQLEDVSQQHRLNPETTRPLIEMVAAALSQNPRRVKQFANNLEARLRIIEQREAEGRISPPISDQVLVIAKLAILEEQWPKTYARLVDNPRLLDVWHSQILQGDAPSAAEGDDQDPIMRRFLSISRDVRAANLSAFLRLKQSQDEIDIPRFAEFRESLALGNLAEVEAIVTQEPESAVLFAQHLGEILDEELRRGFYDGARAVVEATVSIEALASDTPAVQAVIGRAVADAELRRRLQSVLPKPLFLAARSVGDDDRNLLIDEFLDLKTFSSESPTRLAQVCDGLAAVSDLLSDAARDGLTSQLRDPEVNQYSDAVLPLGRADPELLPAEVGSVVVERVTGDLDVDSANFALLLDWLKGSRGREQQTPAILALIGTALVPATLAAALSEQGVEPVVHRLEGLAGLARLLKGAQPDVVQSAVFQPITAPLTAWDTQLWKPLVLLLGCVADLAPDIAAPELARYAAELIGNDPAQAVELAEEEGEQLPETLKGALIPHLRNLMSGGEQERRLPAAAAVAAIDPEDSRGELSGGIADCISKSLFLTAARQIDTYAQQLGQHLSELIDLALQTAAALTDSKLADRAFGCLLTLLPRLSEEQLDVLRDLIASFAQSPDPGLAEAALNAADNAHNDARFAARLDTIVSSTFEHLKSVALPTPAVVSFVAEHIDRLQRMEQGGFLNHLAAMVKDPDQRDAALEGIRSLPETPPPREREELVRALIHVEVMETDPALRTELLTVAGSIAGKRGNAVATFRSRLAELEQSGTDADREIWSAITAEQSETQPEDGHVDE
jgi:hypothetical protein